MGDVWEVEESLEDPHPPDRRLALEKKLGAARRRWLREARRQARRERRKAKRNR